MNPSSGSGAARFLRLEELEPALELAAVGALELVLELELELELAVALIFHPHVPLPKG